MTTVLNGLLGGTVAAAISELVGRVLREDAERKEKGEKKSGLRTTAIRLLAGGIAGGVLVWLELSILGVLAVPPDLGLSLFVGVGWAIALFVAWVIWTGVVSEMRPPRVELLRAFVPYLVFGAALGLWIRLTWIT